MKRLVERYGEEKAIVLAERDGSELEDVRLEEWRTHDRWVHQAEMEQC